MVLGEVVRIIEEVGNRIVGGIRQKQTLTQPIKKKKIVPELETSFFS